MSETPIYDQLVRERLESSPIYDQLLRDFTGGTIGKHAITFAEANVVPTADQETDVIVLPVESASEANNAQIYGRRRRFFARLLDLF